MTDVAALSRRVHQIRGSIVSDALIDRGFSFRRECLDWRSTSVGVRDVRLFRFPG